LDPYWREFQQLTPEQQRGFAPALRAMDRLRGAFQRGGPGPRRNQRF
jgi:hypothetical protein